jgi:hypothetical protein
LVQRHVTFSTHWRRVARQIEEGTYQRDLIRARRRARQDIDRDPAGPELELSYDVDIDDDLAAALEEVHRAAEAASPTLASTPGLFGDKPAASDRKMEPASQAATARAVFQPPVPPPTAAGQLPQPMAAAQAARLAAAPAANVTMSAAGVAGQPMTATAPRPPIGAWATAATRPAVPSPAIASAPTNGSAKVATAPRIALPTPPSAQAAPPPSAAAVPTQRAISPFALPASPGAKPAGLKPPPPPSAAKPLGVISPPLTKAPANQQTSKSAASPVAPVAIKPTVAAAPPHPKPAAPNGALSNDDVQRIYKQYVDARKQNSERVDNVKLDSIEKTLRGMLPQLEKKHAGKKIDFEVVVKDGKVALKPIAR